MANKIPKSSGTQGDLLEELPVGVDQVERPDVSREAAADFTAQSWKEDHAVKPWPQHILPPQWRKDLPEAPQRQEPQAPQDIAPADPDADISDLFVDEDATSFVTPNKVIRVAQAQSAITDAVDPGIEAYRQQFRDAPKIDDDYLKTIHGRQQRANKMWAAQQQGIDPAELDTPEDLAAKSQGYMDAEHKRQIDELTAFYKPYWDAAKAVGKDLAGVATDAKHWAMGGPLKAAAATLDLIDQAATFLNKNVADTRFDQSTPIEDYQGAGLEAMVPNIGGSMNAPETVTGTILQAITQFIGAYSAAGKVTGLGNSFGGAMAKGGLAEFVGFKGSEGNLTDLAKLWPAIQNPVFEYLQTSDDDPDVQNRLKNSLVGAGVSAAVAVPLMGVLRGLREIRRQKELTGGTYQEAAERLARGGTAPGEGMAPEAVGSRLQAILGPSTPDAPVVSRAAPIIQEADYAVPDAVAARSLAEVEGSAKAPDVESGMKRVYVLEPKNEPPYGVVEAVDDLGHMQKALRGSGGPKGDWAIYYYDIPADVKPGRVSDVTGNHYRIQIGGKPTSAAPNYSQEIGVNWARIEAPEDVKMAIGQMVDSFAPEIDKARRGHRAFADIIKDAETENAWGILVGERKGNLPRAEEQLALRQLWTASGTKLREVSKLAMTGDAESVFAFRKMMAVHKLIQQEVLGVRTETARALAQWRIPAGGPREMQNQITQALQSGGSPEATIEFAKRIAAISDKAEFAGAIDDMVRNQDTVWKRGMDALREVWINAILSGPKTHLANMLSNTSVLGQSIVERYIASKISSVASPIEGVQTGEAMAMWFGVRAAMRDAVVYAAKSARTGETGFWNSQVPGQVGADTRQIEGPMRRALSAETWNAPDTMLGKGLDMLGTIVTTPGRMLGAEDEFFKTINYRAELWAQAWRQTQQEVQKGITDAGKVKNRMIELISNPDESLRLKAADFTLYNTFTKEPGELSQSIMRVRDMVDRATGTPIGSMIVPFIRTPGNIFKFAFERSPLAPLASQFQADYAAGGSRRDLAMAKMGLGSVVMSVALDLALDGHVTGSGPDGPKGSGKRQALQRSGWQPFSIRVPDGQREDGTPVYRYFSFNRLDPIGMQFGFAAELAEALNNKGGKVDQDWEEALTATVLGASQVMLNKAYLQGFANMVEAVNHPEKGESVLLKTMAGFVPTGVKEIAQHMDPVSRQTHDLISALKARTPGLSKDLPARLDFWGREVEYSSGLGSTYDAVSPVYSRSTKDAAHAIEREFFRLNYFPTHQGVINVEGTDGRNKPIPLRNQPEIRNRFIELSAATKASDLLSANEEGMVTKRGSPSGLARNMQDYGDRTLQQALADVISGKIDTSGQRRGATPYAEANADEQAKMLGDVIRHYHAAAKIQVLREYPRLRELRDTIPSREDLGVEAPF